MNKFINALNSLKQSLMAEQCIKDYFFYKEILFKNEEYNKLDELARFHQKEMCKNKDNNEKYFQEKELYEKFKNKLDSNPILINYQIAKDEVYSLLLDIEHLLR